MSSAHCSWSLGGVDRQADDLHAAPVELGLDARHVAELGRAHRREVLGVREQHRPGVADPVVELDRALGGLRLEVRRGVAELQSHVRPAPRYARRTSRTYDGLPPRSIPHGVGGSAGGRNLATSADDRVAVGLQPGDNAVDVRRRPVLAELELGLDPGDGQLEADDRAQLAGDELARRVVDRPRSRPAGLVLRGQPPDHRLHPGRVVVHGDLP